MRYAPDARAGVPPHVTVMYPFIEPSKLNGRDVAALSELVLATVAFDCSLAVLRHFAGGAVYVKTHRAG